MKEVGSLSHLLVNERSERRERRECKGTERRDRDPTDRRKLHHPPPSPMNDRAVRISLSLGNGGPIVHGRRVAWRRAKGRA